MRRLALATTVLLAFVVAACGATTHDSLMREGLNLLKELTETLETVKDVETAKAAKPKLQATLDKFEDLSKRREKLPEPTEAEQKVLMEKYQKEMEALAPKFQGAMMKIMFDPAISAELKDIDFQRATK